MATGAMWLPWFRSGSAGRNSFAAFRAAQLLGIEWITPFRIFWFLLPVAFVAAGAVWLLSAHRLAPAMLLVVGLVLMASGGVATATVGVEAGSAAAASGGLCTTVLSALGLGRGSRSRRGP
jgi:hypothetical protein